MPQYRNNELRKKEKVLDDLWPVLSEFLWKVMNVLREAELPSLFYRSIYMCLRPNLGSARHVITGQNISLSQKCLATKEQNNRKQNRLWIAHR